MKNIVMFSLLLGIYTGLYAQRKAFPEDQILDKKSFKMNNPTTHNIATRIGTEGFLTLTQLYLKNDVFEVWVGEDFKTGDSLMINTKRKFRKVGTIQTNESSYIFLQDKKNYMQVEAGKDYAIHVKTVPLPKKFIPEGIANCNGQGIFFDENSILLFSPENEENQLINILPEVSDTPGKISRIQTFENSDEIIIYVVSTTDVKSNAMKSLIRYDIKTRDAIVMDVSDINYLLEGECIIAPNKTIFTGTEISKPGIIMASHFLVFEGSERKVSKTATMAFLLEEDLSAEPKHKQRSSRTYANTYTPIVLEDGSIFVFTDIYSERGIETFERVNLDPTRVKGYYNSTQSLEVNFQIAGFANNKSIAIQYDQSGDVIWHSPIAQLPFRYDSDFDDMNSVSLISPDVVLNVNPSYGGIAVRRINLKDKKLTGYYFDVPPVNSTTETFYRGSTPSIIAQKVLKISDYKYLYYGYNETKPIQKKYPIKRNYEFQVLELEE